MKTNNTNAQTNLSANAAVTQVTLTPSCKLCRNCCGDCVHIDYDRKSGDSYYCPYVASGSFFRRYVNPMETACHHFRAC